jgi:carbamate kinase
MLVVVALGGNALIRRGQAPDADVQRANVRVAAEGIAAIAREHRVVLTHGNGPQVGLLALQNEAYRGATPYPLDVLGAETEGMVGYLLEQELARHLGDNHVAALLTQVVVDPADPAFATPTKFVGPLYTQAEALALAQARHWSVAADGDAWRRVVASPEPVRIVELGAIRLLVDHGVTVVCTGGGGIPVVADAGGGLVGVEGVIDKDLSASLLASNLGADALVLLTDVDAVYEGFGTPAAQPIHHTTVDALRALTLPSGSMGPKVDAICRFVERGGRYAAIGKLDDAVAVVRGQAGTVLSPGTMTTGHGPS